MISAPVQEESTDVQGISEFAMRLIKKKARRLSRVSCFTSSDVADLECELVLQLLTNRVRYIEKSEYSDAVAATIIKGAACSILRREQAKKRGLGKVTLSLDESIRDADGNATTLADTIADERQPRADYSELAFDVRAAIAELPSDLRDIANRLQYNTPTEIARELGITRSAMSTKIEKIRAVFLRMGLFEYVEGLKEAFPI